MENKKLKLAHLYPKELNLYGDIGNIIALKKRCEWRGIELEINNIDIGDNLTEHDIYFIGGGQDKQQIDVSYELQNHKEFLTAEMEKGAVILAICGGFQLLAQYYQAADRTRLLGINLLDAYTIAGKSRLIGNVTAEVDFLEPNTLVGFENHIGHTYLQGDTKPLAKILIGKGNNGKDFTEGARHKNVFGTYLHGALLPKNPHFTDYLIQLALNNKYGECKLAPLDDEIELQAHNSVLNKKH